MNDGMGFCFSARNVWSGLLGKSRCRWCFAAFVASALDEWRSFQWNDERFFSDKLCLVLLPLTCDFRACLYLFVSLLICDIYYLHVLVVA